jgi:UDP-hydrolysing UDP-N-acetyl-D-glucosamine 2-epimerase
MNRRIAIVTGTRAEYGLLRGVVEGVHDSASLDLQLIVTGMHLSPEFGLSYREIEADGLPIAERIEILLSSDTATGVSKAVGLGLIGFADAFDRLKPDLLVLLGDRFEILAAATAALVAGIPIAHIHGGETTEGAIDEAIRHSITKMASLHFVAAAPYRDRVVQLGEAPERVFLVGALGVDAIRQLKPLDRAELEQSMDFRFGERNLMITFHPPTVEGGSAQEQMRALFEALDTLGAGTHLIFTQSNADAGGRALSQMVEDYVAGRANASCYASLGQLRYLSCLAHVDGVIGNSSSGIIEAPSLGVGTVNIGDRQAGRLRASSVIDCAPTRQSIKAALERLFSAEFQASLKRVDNPYGSGGAAAAILKVLREHPLEGLTRKHFHDMACAQDAPTAGKKESW